MGMAASQARFLGLTARKTNTEFEGQQINQQRTALSNQSANYYNQLLGMQVPVPPSISDYTKTVYTFQDGALSNSITSMIAQPNGEYLISYISSWTDDFAAVAAASSIVTRNEHQLNANSNSATLTQFKAFNKYGASYQIVKDDDTYKLTETVNGETTILAKGLIKDGDKYKSLDGVFTYEVAQNNNSASAYYSNIYTLTDKNGKIITNSASKIGEEYFTHNVGSKELRVLGAVQTDDNGEYIGNDEYLKTLSPDQIKQLIQEENNYMAILNKQYGNSTWTVRYEKNTTSGTWSPYFTKEEVMDQAIYSDTDSSQSFIPVYTIGSTQKTEEVKGVIARFEQDATGRLMNVTLKPGKLDEVTYSVTTNTTTDHDKYNDAMNQYEYDKHQYDQYIQEINAKIEIIQAEDKNLELRLKQLDTEQKAIQTEIDAVSKVIEKNTESSFKTFG